MIALETFALVLVASAHCPSCLTSKEARVVNLMSCHLIANLGD